MVVIDTNIIIDHLRLPPGSETHFLKILKLRPDDKFCISVISVQELYQGKTSLETPRENDILKTLDKLNILPYDFKTAKFAGGITRDSKRPIGLADAAIAATAITNKAPLATLNKKDFQGIPDLEFV